MGDRAIVQVVGTNQFTNVTEAGPAMYLHWSGSDAPSILRELAQLMRGRDGDVAYASARLIGIAHTRTPGNLSLGVFNTNDEPVTADDSHGDSGVFIVDCNTWDVTTIDSPFENFNARETEDAV